MAGLIPPGDLEQIRAASDIVEVIGGYLGPLKRAGANFVTLCPFHREKSPSFNVNPHKQIFHCFGCHKGGDVFTFVREYENITFIEAVRRLAERAKIPLKFEEGPGAAPARQIKETLLQIQEQICQRWQAALANDAAGQIARDYLAKRGVTAAAIKLFRLGYAPDKWDDTVNWAKSKGYEPGIVEQAGLILQKAETRNYYDRFRGRLMFPICDEQGRVIAFSGRVLTGDEKTAKYVNSPETPIFTKGKVFFGLDKSKRALLDRGFAVICEGQLDLIACYMGGVQNIVAPQGTAFTADHARILRRYVNEVVLCFDADTAGQNAAIRSLDPLLAAGFSIRVATVPAGKDPDAFIKEHGGAAFAEIIESAEGFFDYHLNRLCALHAASTDKGRAAILQAMAEAVHKTGDAAVIDKFAQKTALRLGVTPQAARDEFKKRGASTRTVTGGGEPAPENEVEAQPLSLQEFWLLKLALQNDDCVEWLAERLDPRWLVHPVAQEIIARRCAAHTGRTWQGIAPFLAEFPAESARALITEALTRNIVPDHHRGREIPRPLDQLRDLACRFRDEFITRQSAELTRRMATLEPSSAAQEELLRQQQTLRELRRQPIA